MSSEPFSLTPFEGNKPTRFTIFREWIEKAYKWKYNTQPRWGGMEAKNLMTLLQEMPNLTEKEFCLALKNILNSHDIPEMQRPGDWLPRLESYIVHPHNTFGRRPDAIIETSQTQRQKRNDAAFAEARKIFELLQIQVQTFPGKSLETAEIERWVKDLEPYLMEAIEWAFDNWRRNGHFFPVPGDILDQCDAWTPAIQQGLCSKECRDRHGKGLAESDVLWLWKRFSKKRAEVERALTEDEKQELLLELDQVRGGPPEWRKDASTQVPF